MKTIFSDIRLALFDFDGVFTDNHVYVSEDGKETVKCCRSDGIGISRIMKLGIKCYVISSERNLVVEERCRKINIPFEQNVDDKEISVLEICKKNNIHPKNTMFLGNDINDIPAFKTVGFPFAVADSFPEIKKYVIYKTKANGGHGAVREICDLIYNAKRKKNKKNT